MEDWPVETLPLGEKPTAVGMLLLRDTQQYEASLLHPFASRFVPDRHVLAAAHSPRGELDEQHLLAAKVRQRDRFAIVDPRQGEVGMLLPDLRRMGRGRVARGRAEDHPTGRKGESELPHRSSPRHWRAQ